MRVGERTRGDLNPRAFSCTGFPVQRRTTRLQVQNKLKKNHCSYYYKSNLIRFSNFSVKLAFSIAFLTSWDFAPFLISIFSGVGAR